MASQSYHTYNCRIYREDQLQRFNPNQPFSTAGGYADLYRASHPQDGEIALKRPRWGTEDLADRFTLAHQEASVWQVLSHPNVLKFLGILYSSPHIYLVSPFASHGSLPQYLRAYPDADRPIFISQISSGLAYLHSKGIIHGDVKGANVVVSPTLTAQLCDFGLSKFADTATSTGGKGSSLPWLSPERMDRLDSPRTKESDVYAFGMTIYEILSGVVPFNTLGVDALQIAVCVHNARPPTSPEYSRLGTPYTATWFLADMCWVKQPERRPLMSESCAFFEYHRIGWPALPYNQQGSEAVTPSQATSVQNDARHDSIMHPTPTSSSSDGIALHRKRAHTSAHDFGGIEASFQHPGGASVLSAQQTHGDQLSRATNRLSLHHHREVELDPSHGNAEATVHFHAQSTSESFPRVEGLLRAKSASHRSERFNAPSACLEGTRIAVLEKVYEWAKSTDPNMPRIFWLNGMAGTGKSTIAQTFAEQADQERILGASFFFSRHGNAEVRTASLVVPTIAFQLAHNIPSFMHHLNSAIAKESDVSHYIRPHQLQILLAGPLQAVTRSKPIIVVLDALDECEGRDATELLHLLFSMISQPTIPSTLKLFITCRPEPELDLVLQRARAHQKFILHDVEDNIIEADIELYLKTGLKDLQQHHSLPPDWPSLADLKELVRRSGKLFVYATTTLKYIREYDFDSPQEKLQSVLRASYSSEKNVLRDMDELYLQVLRAAITLRASRIIEATVKRQAERIRSVLGGMVALHTPLSLRALEGLFGIPFEQIATTLKHLQSVVLPPESPNHSPQFLHQSFPDFLVNPDRCTDERFLIHTVEHDRRLATQCLTIMTKKFTTGLATSDLPNVSDDEYRPPRFYDETIADTAIEPELAYACRFWASHLANAPVGDPELMEQLGRFARTCVLRWLEVLSLTEQVAVAARAADDAYKWAVSSKCCDQITSLLHDTRRFVLAHLRCICEDPHNVISCALPFLPSNTSFRKQYVRDITFGIHVLGGIEAEWSPCLSVLEGHSGQVNTVVFSSDGSRIASSSWDGTVRIWDALSGQHIATLRGHSGMVSAIAFSSDGSRIASGSGDCTVRIWGGVSGQPVATLRGHSGLVSAIAFSSDGSRIASGSLDCTARIWDALSGQPIATLRGHSGMVRAVAFSSDCSRIASGSDDCTVRIWGGVSGQPIATLRGHSSMVRAIAFLSDGSRIASGSLDGTLRMWDTLSGQPIATLKGHSGGVETIAFSSDGSRIASGSNDSTVRIWDAFSGHPIAILKGHSGGVETIAFSSDGSRIASGSDDCTVRIWGGVSGQPIATLRGHSGMVRAVAFSSDGSRIASGSDDHTVRIWDALSGQHIATLRGHSSWVETIAFSSDGSRIASGSHDGIRIWDAPSGQPIATIWGHSGVVTAIAFSSDGSRIASGSDDCTVRIWGGVSGQPIAALRGHSSWVNTIAFSSNGSRIASGSGDKTVRLWDVVSGQPIATLWGHSLGVNTIAFSSDGSRIASGSWDGTVRIWDAVRGQHIGTVEGHFKYPLMIAFSADDSRILVRDIDGGFFVWLIIPRVLGPCAPSNSDIALARILPLHTVNQTWALSVVRGWARVPTFTICESRVTSVGVSPDRRIIAVGCDSGRVFILHRPEHRSLLPV